MVTSRSVIVPVKGHSETHTPCRVQDKVNWFKQTLLSYGAQENKSTAQKETGMDGKITKFHCKVQVSQNVFNTLFCRQNQSMAAFLYV
jgi:hypothetical protein